MEKKLHDISEMKNKLIDWMKEEIDKGKICVDTKEAGEVIDMIKDLAEAEKDIEKACYYKEMTKLLKEESEEGPMGYNNRRYSSGQYAPKGRGHISGYVPEYPNVYDMMGYSGGGGSNSSNTGGSSGGSRGGNSNGGSNSGGSDSGSGSMGYPYRTQVGGNIRTNMGYSEYDNRYGKPYNDYMIAKRHYHESKSPEDKKEMESHMSEHVGDTIATLRELWNSSEPDMKRRIKNDFTSLLGEMTI